jgi:hypothetical protein
MRVIGFTVIAKNFNKLIELLLYHVHELMCKTIREFLKRFTRIPSVLKVTWGHVTSRRGEMPHVRARAVHVWLLESSLKPYLRGA